MVKDQSPGRPGGLTPVECSPVGWGRRKERHIAAGKGLALGPSSEQAVKGYIIHKAHWYLLPLKLGSQQLLKYHLSVLDFIAQGEVPGEGSTGEGSHLEQAQENSERHLKKKGQKGCCHGPLWVRSIDQGQQRPRVQQGRDLQDYPDNGREVDHGVVS